MPDQPLRLRQALPGDGPGCAYVHHTSWAQTYSDLVPTSHWETDTLQRRAEGWERQLNEGAVVTVAELDGRIVGIAAAREAQAVGEHGPVRELDLSLLYVLADHHGTGVGQALLDTVLPPGTPAQLWVAELNPRARAFYERNWFDPDGARYTDPGLKLAEIRLVR